MSTYLIDVVINRAVMVLVDADNLEKARDLVRYNGYDCYLPTEYSHDFEVLDGREINKPGPKLYDATNESTGMGYHKDKGFYRV